MAVFRAIGEALHYVCLSIAAWIGIGACSACDNLRATLVATIEQLNIARKACDDLRLANNNLRVECATTGRMMHDVFRKLIMTSNYADEMREDSMRVEGELLRQEPELIRLRKELNGMGSQIKALRAMDEANPVHASDSEAWQRCRRLEEGREVLQRKLDTANAKNAELFYQNEEMSRKLRLAKKDADSTAALTQAKEDIEWYEAETIKQQESIFELRRLLGLSREAKREMRESLKLEIQRLREDRDTTIETLQCEHEEQLAAFVDQVNETYRRKFAEWKKNKMEAVERARSYSALENEDRIHEAVMERLEVRRLESVGQITKWENQWKEKVAVLKKENRSLRSEMLEMRDFMDAEIEQAVVHRLSSESGLERTKLVKELQGKIKAIESQLKDEQRLYQERLQEAVIEGWRLSSDEKIQKLLEVFDQMKEDLNVSQQNQDVLMEQVVAIRKIEVDAYRAHDDAAKLRQVVAENDKQIEQQKGEIERLSADLSVLRPALEKVVAAQDATMEANERHQQDLKMARNQVATLVDQVSELEDHVESLRMAGEEAQKMHKMLLDAEKRKTREAVAALNATQAMSLPIQEEQMSDVSSDESSDGNDIMTQRTSLARGPTDPLRDARRALGPDQVRLRFAKSDMGRDLSIYRFYIVEMWEQSASKAQERNGGETLLENREKEYDIATLKSGG
ncbi:hypothetical protein NliqN6_1646 [Naganishia liquefaciens]|uniref:Uncharacterized protein n=1 Tax=Naganishia liquefaciens TaxID=104408 RepID=A0A8H3TQR8_9TREE|nr:hypothetical protein NliqN6_1646 [Naganishia liquefaciens]